MARANPHADLGRRVPVYGETELLAFVEERSEPLLLVLDCVQDPQNLGACLRSAYAAGVQAVVTPRRRSAPLSETVRRVACGAGEKLFFAQVTNLARALRELQELGVRLVGTDHRASSSLYDEDLTGPLALVLGGEDSGVRRLTAETCDVLVSIPMAHADVCLNVSAAAAVCLFEAQRQRTSGSPGGS